MTGATRGREFLMVSSGLKRAASPGAPIEQIRPGFERRPTGKMSPAAWALIPIVAASGFAGLGYEIVWTRMLSLALGTEMMAVLGVVAGFFGGLALGAFALDRVIREARSPRLAYAVLEAVIGLWGVVSVYLLPAASRALPPLLGTEPSPLLLWGASFALPALVLLPATVAMGGTLAALDRMVVAATGDHRISAGIYGANTAGAVAGTLAATFLLLPALGLSGTLLALAAVNALCALASLTFGPAASEPAVETQAPMTAGAGQTRLSLTLFATGLLGVAFEVVAVRLAAQFLQDTIYSFAGLLAAYLLGTAAGGLAWQAAGKRVRSADPTWLFALTALIGLATAALAPEIARLAARSVDAGILGELGVALALFLLPSAAMGALFGHLAQAVRDRRGSLGHAVGINSLGAALAPAITSLFLIPAFGTWNSLVVVSLLYLLLAPVRRVSLAWAALPAAAGAILLVGPAPTLIRIPEGGRLLALREGSMATASAVDDASGARYLEVNGHFRMGGTSSARSDYRQAMVPLLLHPAPGKALFLGIGTGATLIGGARMPGVSVQGVELSPEVAALLPWFADPSIQTPPPPITVADARRYVVADRGRYDVIIADLYHPALDGSGALYTREHFAAIRERLAPGGLFCQWLPLYQLDLPSLQIIIRSFLDVYPGASAWLNHYSVKTPMLALIGPRDPAPFDVAALAGRLQDPATGAMTQPVGLSNPIDLLGQYVGGAAALGAFAGQGPRNTDDFPAVTLDARRNVRALTAPPANLLLAVIHGMKGDPAALLATPDKDGLGTRLSAYWKARDRFIEAGAGLQGEPRGLDLVAAASPGLLDSIRLSPEFDPGYGPLIGMAQMLAESDRPAALRLLRQIDEAAPSRGEARALIGQLSATLR
jgi:spermidine synthase